MIYKKNFNQIFIMFLFFLISFCFLSLNGAKKTLAYATIVDYCVDGQIGICGKGGSGDSCPYCGTSKDYCCSDGSAWTKYNTVCKVTVTKRWIPTTGSYQWISVYTITLTPSISLCSTMDKWVDHTWADGDSPDNFLYSSDCECNRGGIYKYCCDAAGYPEYPTNGSNVDGRGDWEADCPGSNPTVGYGVTGDRVRSSQCTPNCVPNCGDTNSQCWGVVYGNGCGGSCTGTGLNADNNCASRDSHCAKDGVYASNACGTCTGTIPTSTCSDAGSHCVKDGVYFDNGCGTCTGTVPTSTCSDAGSRCVKDGVYFNNGCGTCTGTIPTVNGTSGVCGASNGARLQTTPTTGLCTSGTASAVTVGTNAFTWTCPGTVGTCGGTTGTTANCSAIRDLPPVIEEIKLYKNDGTTLIPPTTINGAGWNHICETTFNNEKTVKWWVRANDGTPNVSDVASIRLRLTTGANCTGSVAYESAIVPASNGISIFTVDTSTIASSGTAYYACAIAYDQHPPLNSGWMDTNRRFKVWNCNVAVSGRLYNGGASGSCSVGTDYSTPAINTNFNTLDFTDSPTMNMNRSSENEYNGNLTWGKFYTAAFNNDIAMQISGSGVKTTDVSDSNRTFCPNSIAFNLNSTILNPYSTSPTLRVDFSGVVDQDSWYQAVGGGLLANRIITNRVPVTCTTNCAMSINGTTNTNGMVSGPTINNTGNSDANKGSPNNWWINKALAETNSEYGELLNQFFYKAGVGTTFNGDKKLSEIGNNGVNFVKGDLLVTEDNNVSSGQFLMVIVDGNIIVQSNVKNLEGVFVSKNLNIGGSDTNALTIEGMVKATENVKINRTFINKRTNNTAAAVKFIYRPDFIFSMPGAITKQLTKWQWGN